MLDIVKFYIKKCEKNVKSKKASMLKMTNFRLFDFVLLEKENFQISNGRKNDL